LSTTFATKAINVDAANAVTNVEYTVDGIEHIQYPVDTAPVQFLELQRTLGNIFSTVDTSICDVATYLATLGNWLLLAPHERFEHNKTAFFGNNVMFQITGPAAANTT
jgi:hypothetical protein